MVENMDKFYYVLVVAVLVALALIVTAIVLFYESKDDPEGEGASFETRKIRFAAVTFTGLMMLILCSLILAISDTKDDGVGFKLFEKMLTALSPIAGGIIGYLFSSKPERKPEKPDV